MTEFPYPLCFWGFRHQPGWAEVSDPCTDESPFGSICPSAETQGLLQFHFVAPVAGSCGQGCLPAPAHLLFLHTSWGCAMFSCLRGGICLCYALEKQSAMVQGAGGKARGLGSQQISVRASSSCRPCFQVSCIIPAPFSL